MGSTVQKILTAGVLSLGMAGFLGSLFNEQARAGDAPVASQALDTKLSLPADKDEARRQVTAYEEAKLWTPHLESEGGTHTISTITSIPGRDGKKLEVSIHLEATVTDGNTGAALSRSVPGERGPMLDALFCLGQVMDAQIKAGQFKEETLGEPVQGVNAVPHLILSSDMLGALRDRANEQLSLMGSTARVDLPQEESVISEYHPFYNALGREGFHIPAEGAASVRIELAPRYISSAPKNSKLVREANASRSSFVLFEAFLDRLKGRSPGDIQKMMRDPHVLDEIEEAANKEMKASGLPGKVIFDRRTIDLRVRLPDNAPAAPAP